MKKICFFVILFVTLLSFLSFTACSFEKGIDRSEMQGSTFNRDDISVGAPMEDEQAPDTTEDEQSPDAPMGKYPYSLDFLQILICDEIRSMRSNTTLRYVSDAYKDDIAVIINYILSLPKVAYSENEEAVLTEKINSAKNDVCTLTAYYTEFDLQHYKYDQETETVSAPYLSQLNDFATKYNEYIVANPNYYQGSEAEYINERAALSKRAQQASIDYDKAKKNYDTYKLESYKIAMNNSMDNLTSINKQIKELDERWEQRKTLDRIIAECNEVYDNYLSALASLELKYTNVFQDSMNLINSIVEQYK